MYNICKKIVVDGGMLDRLTPNINRKLWEK